MNKRRDSNRRILISEIFGPVFQGEGPIIGKQTIFVRVFGCDSRCEHCDTMYAVDVDAPGAETRKLMDPEDIVDKVEDLCPDYRIPVTISGGNPAIWDLSELVKELDYRRRQIWVETQGTRWADWLMDCDKVIVSPKGPGMNDVRLGSPTTHDLEIFTTLYDLTFKVVIFSPADLDYAETIHEAFPTIPMYLSVGSPVGEYDRTAILDNMKQVMEWVLERPKLHFTTVLPQLHALAHGGSRGV